MKQIETLPYWLCFGAAILLHHSCRDLFAGVKLLLVHGLKNIYSLINLMKITSNVLILKFFKISILRLFQQDK